MINTNLFIDLGGIYPLSLVLNEKYSKNTREDKELLAYEASRPIYGYNGELEEVILAGYSIKNVEVVFTEDKTGGDHTNLTIGLPLFQQFNLIFDYKNEYLYLKTASIK